MTLQVKTFVLGPIGNNSYLIYDDQTLSALVIDPSINPEPLAQFIQEKSLHFEIVLITHAHFDHFYGLPFLRATFPSIKEVYLHPDDLDLWRSGGSARLFSDKVLSVPEPNQLLNTAKPVTLDKHEFSVLHAPGHTTGSVIFYSAELKCAFVGDVIFFHGIGRTDLDGANFNQLIHSIQTQVFTLPEETILYSGHGPSTTVSEEKANNPFFQKSA
jgi:hydroxyacylglutathione hydrolase